MALLVPLSLPATTALVDDQVVEVPAREFPSAYARILFARAHAARTYISVLWYADEAARRADENPVKAEEFSVETTALAGDIYPAAYEFLKTLPLFKDAVDVIEPPAPVVPPTEEPPLPPPVTYFPYDEAPVTDPPPSDEPPVSG